MKAISQAQLVRLLDRQAKQHCCNCYRGFCCIKDRDCAWRKMDEDFSDRGIICRWFREAVLPANKDLEQIYEMWKQEESQRREDEYRGVSTGNGRKSPEGVGLCFACGETIVIRSNRQKYCEKCAEVERLRRDAARKRRTRNAEGQMSAFRAEKV